MKAFSSAHLAFPLPDGHRFPATKYPLLVERVQAGGWVADEDLLSAPAASETEILGIHTEDYWARLREGRLERREERELGFPWSSELVVRARHSAGGTLAAAHRSLADGVAVNLAGGTHHAFPDRGAGFCLLNDVAIAIRALQEEGLVRRALVVDCDVHQGDGTAAIFREDPDVFTVSLHGRKNYPARKQRSDLDVHLEDGTGDGTYLAALDVALWEAEQRFEPELVFYLAGADPYEGDRLGRLALSKAGLEERDKRVLERYADAGLPIAVVMAGGYAERIEDIVDIHTATVRVAAATARQYDR